MRTIGATFASTGPPLGRATVVGVVARCSECYVRRPSRKRSSRRCWRARPEECEGSAHDPPQDAARCRSVGTHRSQPGRPRRAANGTVARDEDLERRATSDVPSVGCRRSPVRDVVGARDDRHAPGRGARASLARCRSPELARPGHAGAERRRVPSRVLGAEDEQGASIGGSRSGDGGCLAFASCCAGGRAIGLG